MDFQLFNGQHWSRTIPEIYAAFAKSAAVLGATPIPEAKNAEPASLSEAPMCQSGNELTVAKTRDIIPTENSPNLHNAE